MRTIPRGMLPRWARWIVCEIQDAALRVARLARSDAGRFYEVEGRAGAEDEPSYEDRAQFLQHYGFRSRPAADSLVATLCHMGASSQRVIVADETPGAGPSDQEEGEVELYSTFGQRIRLRTSGRLTLETSHGSRAELREDGSVVITDAAGGQVRLADKRLTAAEDVACSHDLGTGVTPTALQLLPQVVVTGTAGTDRLFEVSFNVVNNPVPPAPCLQVTFARSYGAAPLAVMAHHGGERKKITWQTSQTGITVSAEEQLPVGTSYALAFYVGGTA